VAAFEWHVRGWEFGALGIASLAWVALWVVCGHGHGRMRALPPHALGTVAQAN